MYTCARYSYAFSFFTFLVVALVLLPVARERFASALAAAGTVPVAGAVAMEGVAPARVVVGGNAAAGSVLMTRVPRAVVVGFVIAVAGSVVTRVVRAVVVVAAAAGAGSILTRVWVWDIDVLVAWCAIGVVVMIGV
jgi:hypothetical protein